jgi:hypothetical protein
VDAGHGRLIFALPRRKCCGGRPGVLCRPGFFSISRAVRTIILSEETGREMVQEVFRAGARGFVDRSQYDPALLTHCVQCVSLLLPSLFKLLQGRPNITLVYDRVSLEDTRSLPSRNAHDDFLRYAGGAQVPCRCPAQVMEEKGRCSGSSAEVLPALPEVTYGLITAREHVLLRALALQAVAKQLEQRSRLDRDLTPFLVLGRARSSRMVRATRST